MSEIFSNQIFIWIAFNLFVLAMLAFDLGVFHRKTHEVGMREALIWSAVWITLALLFNLGILYFKGKTAALEFLTGYLIEKSLSVDNIFVFALVFSYFNVPSKYQHKVLFWGVLGALVMRGIMIAAGAALITKFHWIIYIFGGFLVLTGIRMAFQKETEIHPDKNPAVRLFKKLWPVTSDYSGSKFFVKLDNRRWATPLFVVLIVVEVTDLVFAVDSIPAIFAITRDTFIVYTSNVFAILGLRSLYFALAGSIRLFRFLKLGLAIVLIFVGIKMVLADIFKIPIVISLIVVAGIIGLAVLLSLALKKKESPETAG